MKNLFFLLSVLLIISCNCNKKEPISETKIEVIEELTINQIMKDTVDDVDMLLGQVNKKGFKNEPFSTWFDTEFSGYTINEAVIDSIQPLVEHVTLKVFMGTWCEDSQRETPRLYKVLEAIDFNKDNLEIIAVSRDKDTPNHLEEGQNIEYVPTIIVLKNEKEIGRIVESTIDSLEEDLLAILSGKEYKHAYAE
ncbi:MAG: thiol-disulfide isomerase/thioredoxin [Flavobacteriaceae bacterium]|jgi:thiol-disulfide isomerase/thioredoxin|uniref:TlpA family protein disulfide reductase n=1 Tax=Candidatus Marifrigoribacter sp. Uisw_064 TaxID=3230970 RepID=UPI003AE58933